MTPDEQPETSDGKSALSLPFSWSADLDSVIREFPLITLAVAAGGFESGQFLLEALACYEGGLYLASLTCAHATCERELAGRVAHAGAIAPEGWERWGLGRLIQHARTQAWHSASTLELLEAVNEKRKTVYHFRELDAEGGLFWRTYADTGWHGFRDMRADLKEQLRMDALEAIRAALAVRAE